MSDTMTVTITADAKPVAERLQQLAREFSIRGDAAETFAELDRWNKEAAQLRLVAHLSESSPDEWLRMGRQWIDAAMAVLDARGRS